MKKLTTLFLSGLACFAISSCEKLFIAPDPKNTPQECFDAMWTTIDQKYSFLDYKHINWDSVKAVYQPDISNDMGDIALFKVLDSMLYTLKDGHVNLTSPFNVSRNWQWYLGYPQNFNYSVIERYYLGTNYYITGPFINQLFIYNNKRIGYMYYNSFSNNFSDYDLDFMINRFNTCEGLIIDVRNNGGGIVDNVFSLLGRFVAAKTMVGNYYVKNGKGHSDFSLSYEMYGAPTLDSKGNTNVQFLDKPIVILTNRSCYSACNMFVGFMSVLPNVTIIGDQTGGGGGLPTANQLPNGWVYRFSSTYTTLPNGLNLEGGVPVNIHQNMDSLNIAKGIDDILNRALLQF
ncbi:MAG TPA: S41 family peptidase [Cytophagaceae bacterium]|jgi:hypothetical protein|nr:S41 family peptidase [Cytophagaceae bacterium]